MTKRIRIFRPGRHVSAGGEALSFSESDVRAAAAAYDPSLHEAPLVIGHPSSDAPAYGWVRSLAFAEGHLQAEPAQVDPAFAELVEAGRYKHVSASFYRPGSPNNPAGESYYLRHVGFLGAQPPSVKGLGAVELGEAGEDVVTVEFGEANGSVIQEALRRLREWIIGTQGKDAADEALPGWLVDEAERETPDSTPAYTETPARPSNRKKEAAVSDTADQDAQAREAEIKRREAAIQEREAEFAEREARARQEQHATAVDKLVEQGRVLPRHRPGLVALFAELDSTEHQLEFAEAESGRKKQQAPADFLESFLGDLPERISYAELSGEEGERDHAAEVAAPAGYSVRPERAELHRRALSYAEQHNVDYVTAARAVERQH